MDARADTQDAGPIKIKIFYPDTSLTPIQKDDVIYLENTSEVVWLLKFMKLHHVSCIEMLGRKTWYALRGEDAMKLHETIGEIWIAESVIPEGIVAEV
jgi:hypothetical protein